jgi:hypothetical protein
VPKYDHAGSRNGVIWCQMALWGGPGAAPSRRSPGSYTWSLQWPALDPNWNAPFGVCKRLPGPFWLAGAWAAPVWPRARWPRGLGSPSPVPGPSRGGKYDQHTSLLVDPSAPRYDNAGSRNIVIWCRMALWGGPLGPSSPRSPGSCTWSLRWPALGPTLNAPFGWSKLLPWPFWPGWPWAGPGWPSVVGMHPGGAPGGGGGKCEFLVGTSAAEYDHPGSRSMVLWHRIALWSGLGRRPAPRVLGCALGPFSGQPWGPLRDVHLAHLNCASGGFLPLG